MSRRHPLIPPHLWLLTDPRQGAALWRALRRLPHGAGVVVRHYDLPAGERRAFFRRVRQQVHARGGQAVLAGPAAMASRWGADGSYGDPGTARRHRAGLRLAPVHDRHEIRQAERRRADLLLLSPLFATRSHPGARGLGPLRFAGLARATQRPVIALGGVSARHEGLLRKIGAAGWAGIDAFAAG